VDNLKAKLHEKLDQSLKDIQLKPEEIKDASVNLTPFDFAHEVSSVKSSSRRVTKLFHASMAGCHVSLVIFRTMDIMKLQRLPPPKNLSRMNTSRFGDRPLWFKPFTVVKVGEQSFGSGLVMDDTLAKKKRELYQAVEGINRGIFGLPSAKKFEIESLDLRALNAIWVSPLSGKQVPKLNPFSLLTSSATEMVEDVCFFHKVQSSLIPPSIFTITNNVLLFFFAIWPMFSVVMLCSI
ncbi:hypothetical protein S83_067061, partial [Arachis hypogaea]